MNCVSRMSKYETLELVGSGTYGRIYRARRRQDGLIVALKQMPFDAIPAEERKEALNEAKVMERVNHPSFIKYYESFVQEGILNIVMEYAEGGDLGKRLRSRDRGFDEGTLWRYLTQISKGLEFLHKNRILHRDIKPDNVFLDRSDNIKIGDLGLGRILGSRSVAARTSVGTPLYFSPELCQDRPYDDKSDIWALGCLMYELITMQPPFFASNQIALARKIVKTRQAPLPARVSSTLRYLINKMLEKDPKKRPDIKQIVEYDPIKLRIRFNKARSDLKARYTAKCSEVLQLQESHRDLEASLAGYKSRNGQLNSELAGARVATARIASELAAARSALERAEARAKAGQDAAEAAQQEALRAREENETQLRDRETKLAQRESFLLRKLNLVNSRLTRAGMPPVDLLDSDGDKHAFDDEDNAGVDSAGQSSSESPLPASLATTAATATGEYDGMSVLPRASPVQVSGPAALGAVRAESPPPAPPLIGVQEIESGEQTTEQTTGQKTEQKTEQSTEPSEPASKAKSSEPSGKPPVHTPRKKWLTPRAKQRKLLTVAGSKLGLDSKSQVHLTYLWRKTETRVRPVPGVSTTRASPSGRPRRWESWGDASRMWDNRKRHAMSAPSQDITIYFKLTTSAGAPRPGSMDGPIRVFRARFAGDAETDFSKLHHAPPRLLGPTVVELVSPAQYATTGVTGASPSPRKPKPRCALSGARGSLWALDITGAGTDSRPMVEFILEFDKPSVVVQVTVAQYDGSLAGCSAAAPPALPKTSAVPKRAKRSLKFLTPAGGQTAHAQLPPRSAGPTSEPRPVRLFHTPSAHPKPGGRLFSQGKDSLSLARATPVQACPGAKDRPAATLAAFAKLMASPQFKTPQLGPPRRVDADAQVAPCEEGPALADSDSNPTVESRPVSKKETVLTRKEFELLLEHVQRDSARGPLLAAAPPAPMSEGRAKSRLRGRNTDRRVSSCAAPPAPSRSSHP